MIAVGVAIAVAAIWWFTKPQPNITTTEFRERLRRLK